MKTRREQDETIQYQQTKTIKPASLDETMTMACEVYKSFPADIATSFTNPHERQRSHQRQHDHNNTNNRADHQHSATTNSANTNTTTLPNTLNPTAYQTQWLTYKNQCSNCIHKNLRPHEMYSFTRNPGCRELTTEQIKHIPHGSNPFDEKKYQENKNKRMAPPTFQTRDSNKK